MGKRGHRSTLSSHDQTRDAVRNAGASRQERDPHDDVGDSQSVANYSHLKEQHCAFNDQPGGSAHPLCPVESSHEQV